MQTKAVIFDKDGTLLDFEAFWIPVTELAVREVLKRLNAENVPLEQVMEAYGVGGGVVDITGVLCCGTYDDMTDKLMEVLAKHGVQTDFASLKALTQECYHTYFGAGVYLPTAKSLKSVLMALKEKGVKLFVVTSDDKAGATYCLQQLGIFDCFDEIFSADGDTPAKPDPYWIHYLENKYGFDKSEIVMVGDTLTDMQFAKNGGVFSVALSKDEKNSKILRPLAGVIIPDPSTLLDVLK